MELVKLKPIIKDYIWGGTYFQSFGKGQGLARVSECWELSSRGPDSSIIDGTNQKFDQVVTTNDIGPIASRFPNGYFPLLIKLIDAKQDLSIQVHPGDKYAAKYNRFGKCEMWHIIHADKGSGLYVGLNRDYKKEEIEKALKDGSILNCLNFYPVKPGDTFVIEPGTIHAIGKGVRLIEIQENSDETFRLFDYNRVDKDGNPRPLHIEKGLDVIDYHHYDSNKQVRVGNCIAHTDFFTVGRLEIDDEYELKADQKSFISFTFLEGSGMVDDIPFNQYDTFFLPYGKKCIIKGKSVVIVSTVGE